jgi:hypothetical protein
MPRARAPPRGAGSISGVISRSTNNSNNIINTTSSSKACRTPCTIRWAGRLRRIGGGAGSASAVSGQPQSQHRGHIGSGNTSNFNYNSSGSSSGGGNGARGGDFTGAHGEGRTKNRTELKVLPPVISGGAPATEPSLQSPVEKRRGDPAGENTASQRRNSLQQQQQHQQQHQQQQHQQQTKGKGKGKGQAQGQGKGKACTSADAAAPTEPADPAEPSLLRSMLRYISDEVRPGGHDVFAEEDTRPELYTFLRVPGAVEKILSLGFFLVADCFLYMFTFLPVRVMCAFWEVISRPVATLGRRGVSSGARIDLARFFIIVVVSAILLTVDTSTVYHYVRVQSAIKLYALFNLLEIGDKLFGSFGMDVFYSLHRTLQWSRGPWHRRWPLPLLIAVIYTLGHTMVLFAQVVALNVAVNSESNVLLTLLISNQFVELKSSVFKKFTKLNLFQITCHDMGERFQLFVFVLSITLPRLHAIDWTSWESARGPLSEVGYVVAVIGASELVIDYVKHAFITKFNFISPDEYTHFRRIILNDLVECRRSHVYVDYSMVISRRIGFSTAPLACLAIRVGAQYVRGAPHAWGVYLVWWLNLVVVKIILGTVLLVAACRSSEKWERQCEAKPAATATMSAWQGRA